MKMKKIQEMDELLELYPNAFNSPFLFSNSEDEQSVSDPNLTVEIFLEKYGDSLPRKREYVATNPNVLKNDLIKLNHKTIPAHYFSNINAFPCSLVVISCNNRNDRLNAMVCHPCFLMFQLLFVLENKDLKTTNDIIHKHYSKNQIVTWENVNDYSWFAWNWELLAQNAFSSSSLYRQATLMNELFYRMRMDYVFNYSSLMKMY